MSWYSMDVLHLTERNFEHAVGRVTSLLKRGGVVAVPTDTVYGLIADIHRDDAVRKVFRIKARSHTKAIPVFVRDIEMAEKYAYVEQELIRQLDELWPGLTTVVLEKRDIMPNLVTGGSKTVGLRVPGHPFIRALFDRYPNPLTGTSANLSGSESAQSGLDIQKMFQKHVPRPDMLVDVGILPPSPSSTVLDMTQPKNPKILRAGAITKEQLGEMLKQWSKVES